METEHDSMLRYSQLAWQTLESTRNPDRLVNENTILAILFNLIKTVEESTGVRFTDDSE